MSALALRSLAVDPIAASTNQSCLRRYVVAGGEVAFFEGTVGSLTLGPPLASPSSALAVAERFSTYYPKAAFFYLTTAQAQALAPLGLRAVPIGEDFIIDLPCTQWSDQATSAHRKAVKAGVTLKELDAAELAQHEPAMRQVQARYFERQEVKHEMRFLTRPCEFAAERVGRTFGLFQRGAMLGFVVVDPYVTERGQPGALLNLFRVGPTKLWGVYLAAVKLLAEQLEAEGVRELSLGFVPLASSTPSSSLQLTLLRALAGTSPYLRGLKQIKEVFVARRETRWLLTPRALLLRDVVTLVEAMGVYRKEAR